MFLHIQQQKLMKLSSGDIRNISNFRILDNNYISLTFNHLCLLAGTPGVCLMSYQAELISICRIFQCIYTLVYLFIYPILIVNHAQNAPTSLSRFIFFKWLAMLNFSIFSETQKHVWQLRPKQFIDGPSVQEHSSCNGISLYHILIVCFLKTAYTAVLF